MDGALGILVTLLILYAAYDILKDTFQSLLGEKPSKQLLEQVIEVCREHSQMEVHPHHVHIHNYGHHTEMTLHIMLPRKIELAAAHDIASVIEDALRKEMSLEVTIHMEPLEEEN